MNVIVIGPRGKMGKLIIQAAAQREDMILVGGVAPKGRDYVGKDLGQAAMLGENLGKLVYDDLEEIIEDCDVIIDFSTRETSMNVLDAARRHKKALVCGTTGFSEEERNKFVQAAGEIPILYAANTSRMVNVMRKLLETAVRLLPEADVEILEMHDQWKIDAPSGTSRELGEAMAKALGKEWEKIAVFGREGAFPREKGTMGYHSLRAGNIPSSHTVFLGGMGERLEITHHSYNWECFARGACDCAVFLEGKPAGYYTIEDVIQL
ncbi:4-hydroxy-tetrahydrodipicolinate reductase [Suipraeoptans intestinalis]|uniref:4-hydroxy-tetrahydrodipicolinate reductase n=1 Tax=Suipraeoptans intestinalis TaxID=2606628 RepID=UPI002A752A30|nr:4-hydroxy-tetrahydrodipicolinate reductase [Suipraeoptans intestinalis]MDY3122709.1 4-hydroxy-tetrahydrodipicolinate reductase [Suipraeoptans intestinalis]